MNLLKIISLLSILSALHSGCAQEKKAKTETAEEPAGADVPQIITSVFKNDTTANATLGGFGYKLEVITSGDTFRIHQRSIPAIQGNKGFISSEDAAKVAELVAEKMRGGNSFPTVGVQELDSLEIKY